MAGATYQVRHRTTYTYEDTALQSQNLACLGPRSFPGQIVEAWRVDISPTPESRQPWTDAYGNARESFSLATPHQLLEVTLHARIRREPVPAVACSLTWEDAVLPYGNAWLNAPYLPREFAQPSPQLPIPGQPGFPCDDCFPPGRPIYEALDHFMRRVHEMFTYDPEATHTFTPLDEVYAKRAGVCQDFAHASIAELRRRGFAAGYVSGYLETIPPPGKTKLLGADATHAWYAVYIPGTGWIHYDPTNNVRAGFRHLVTAWGRDYGDVAPLKGVVLGGGAHEVSVEVDVWPWPDHVPPDYQHIL
jgi:transglutaminase-like putative cysteine protease